jgi:hypothetical protein
MLGLMDAAENTRCQHVLAVLSTLANTTFSRLPPLPMLGYEPELAIDPVPRIPNSSPTKTNLDCLGTP